MKDTYMIAESSVAYATETLDLTIKQGKKGEEKETVNIRVYGVPLERDFPGGDSWTDADGKPVRNPFYDYFLKYWKDHEIAQRRRDGETVFTMLERPESGERGPVTPKMSTQKQQFIRRMQMDHGWSEAQALERWAMMGIPE